MVFHEFGPIARKALMDAEFEQPNPELENTSFKTSLFAAQEHFDEEPNLPLPENLRRRLSLSRSVARLTIESLKATHTNLSPIDLTPQSIAQVELDLNNAQKYPTAEEKRWARYHVVLFYAQELLNRNKDVQENKGKPFSLKDWMDQIDLQGPEIKQIVTDLNDITAELQQLDILVTPNTFQPQPGDTVLSRVSVRRTELDAIKKKLLQLIDGYKNSTVGTPDVLVENKEKATFLQNKYVKQVEDALDLAKKVEQAYWEKNLFNSHPDLKLLKLQLPPDYKDPNFGAGVIGVRERQAEISRLEDLIEKAQAIVDNLNKNVAKNPADADRIKYIIENYIEPAEKERQRRKDNLLKFFEEKITTIFHGLKRLDIRMKRLQSPQYGLQQGGNVKVKDLLDNPITGNPVGLRAIFKEIQDEMQNLGLANIPEFKQIMDKRLEAAREMERLLVIESELDREIGEIRRQLEIFSKETYSIIPEQNRVEAGFKQIKEELRVIRSKQTVNNKERIDELEIEMQIVYFDKLEEQYYLIMNNLEGGNVGVSGIIEWHDDAIKPYILAGMENVVIALTRLNADNDAKKHDKKFQYWKRDRGFRQELQLTTQSLRTHVFEGKERHLPADINLDVVSLSGEALDYFYKEGIFDADAITSSKSEARASNKLLNNGIETVRPTNARDGQVRFKETAHGHCSRIFDAIFRGNMIVKMENNKIINAQNIHAYYLELIDLLAKREKDRAKRLGEEPRYDDHILRRAFNLSTIAFLNASFLQPTSPNVTDKIYYTGDFFYYAWNYHKKGNHNFFPLVTYALSGLRRADGTRISPINIMFEALRVRKQKSLAAEIRAAIAEKDESFIYPTGDEEHERLSKKGFKSYDFLTQWGLIDLRNTAIGDTWDPIEKKKKKTVRLSYMNSPLRHNLDTKVINGERVAYRLPPTDPGEVGAWATKEDVKFVTEVHGQDINGNYVYDASGNPVLYEMEEYGYEDMNFTEMGNGFLSDYFTAYNNNAMNFLDNVLKVSQGKFISNMKDPDFVANLKKDGRFALNFLPKIGTELAAWRRPEGKEDYKKMNYPDNFNLEEGQMNKIILILIMVAGIAMTDIRTHGDKKMARTEVLTYLDSLKAKPVIDEEEAIVLEEAIMAGRESMIALNAMLEELMKQMTNLFTYKF